MSILNNKAPVDRLAGLEIAVLKGVNERRHEFRVISAVVPFGFASIALAMAIGIFVGGMAALESMERPEGAPLSYGARLAPSNLLEGDR